MNAAHVMTVGDVKVFEEPKKGEWTPFSFIRRDGSELSRAWVHERLMAEDGTIPEPGGWRPAMAMRIARHLELDWRIAPSLVLFPYLYAGAPYSILVEIGEEVVYGLLTKGSVETLGFDGEVEVEVSITRTKEGLRFESEEYEAIPVTLGADALSPRLPRDPFALDAYALRSAPWAGPA